METFTTKDSIIEILESIIIPLNFKRKGNNYIKEGPEITKKINLQKPNFSNMYYINYGYNINALPTEDLFLHIYKRCKESNGIYLREDILRMINDIQSINSEADILKMIKMQTNINNIPLVVKKHFHLSAE